MFHPYLHDVIVKEIVKQTSQPERTPADTCTHRRGGEVSTENHVKGILGMGSLPGGSPPREAGNQPYATRGWDGRSSQNLIRRRKFRNAPSACGGDRNFQGFASLLEAMSLHPTIPDLRRRCRPAPRFVSIQVYQIGAKVISAEAESGLMWGGWVTRISGTLVGWYFATNHNQPIRVITWYRG
jgi:hypothetical protein